MSLPTLYQQYIHLSRYSRWNWGEKRRETWEETVKRYFDFFQVYLKDNHGFDLNKSLRKELEDAVLNLEIMPSMRSIMTAGEALERDHMAGYNCSYTAVDSPRAFDEILYVLCCGTGVGFSVERQYVSQLPTIAEEFHKTDTTIVVADSKIGWAKAFKELLGFLYQGMIPNVDYSKIRKAGEPLKTFGGRASGPQPLKDLFNFAINLFQSAAGRKLQSIECHDLVCKIADIVVVGGVRRCLSKDMLILTKTGLKKISDISTSDLVLSSDGKYHKVLAKENVGIKKTLLIQTQAGDIRATPEHRLAVITNPDTLDFEWKQAKDLEKTDQLIFSEIMNEGTITAVPDFSYIKPKHSTTCKDINISSLTTDEWSWFIGYLQGDGCVHNDRGSVSFAVSHDMPKTLKRIELYFNKLGLNVTLSHTEEKCFKPRVKSKQLNVYLKQFKTPRTTMEVPKFVLEGTVLSRLQYLSGVLDSDGSLKSKRSGRKTFILVTSIYYDWVVQIQSVLASLGIPSYIKEKNRKEQNWQTQYTLKIVGSRFKDKFATMLSEISEKVQNDYDFTPSKKEQCSFVLLPELMKKSSRKKQFSSSYSGAISCSWEKFRTGSELFLPIKILNISEYKEEECFDIQVQDTEDFFVNGILSHNSALISLSNLSDDRMRSAKSGQWWIENPQRALANNSAAYTEKPDVDVFMEEWKSLYQSRSGERGVFNRAGAIKHIEGNERRNSDHEWGTNPCGEILLKSRQLCNLSEVIVRHNDTKESLLRKVKLATILGTFQSCLTNFRYVSSKWKNNCEEERLLGVSLTGIFDNPIMCNPTKELEGLLQELKNQSITTNKDFAKKLKINQSTAITCIKPSGTVSQLVDSASGIHPRHSEFYIRTIRADSKDPLCQFMENEVGLVPEDCAMKPGHVKVFSFPVKSPDNGSIYRRNLSAIEHLNLWMIYKKYWSEHTVSVTVSIKENEWLDVAAYVYKNFDDITGISFLPYSDHTYAQAPYQECSKEEYENLLKTIPESVDWSKLKEYENTDLTEGSKEFACTGNKCEI